MIWACFFAWLSSACTQIPDNGNAQGKTAREVGAGATNAEAVGGEANVSKEPQGDASGTKAATAAAPKADTSNEVGSAGVAGGQAGEPGRSESAGIGGGGSDDAVGGAGGQSGGRASPPKCPPETSGKCDPALQCGCAVAENCVFMNEVILQTVSTDTLNRLLWIPKLESRPAA